MNLKERISIKTDVCKGRACVAGTRIPVYVVLDNLAEGLAPAEIMHSYPPLTDEDIRACIAYAASLAHKEVAPLRNLYQLKIDLIGTKPTIWRRLQVPGNANLGWLHAVLQVAMGWTNSHLHQFRIGEQTYSDPAFELDETGDGPPVGDEKKVTLLEVAPQEGDVLTYEYDFGDSWEHRVTVEKVLDPDPAAATVTQCLDGARACPPDDCGGVWGYADLLKVIKNPKDKEYPSMMEWLGGTFDPAAFSIEKSNTYLRKLKWPRVTESQLRKVLMARDDYHE